MVEVETDSSVEFRFVEGYPVGAVPTGPVPIGAVPSGVVPTGAVPIAVEFSRAELVL